MKEDPDTRWTVYRCLPWSQGRRSTLTLKVLTRKVLFYSSITFQTHRAPTPIFSQGGQVHVPQVLLKPFPLPSLCFLSVRPSRVATAAGALPLALIVSSPRLTKTRPTRTTTPETRHDNTDTPTSSLTSGLSLTLSGNLLVSNGEMSSLGRVWTGPLRRKTVVNSVPGGSTTIPTKERVHTSNLI